jgi:neutral ceramidase
MIVRVLLLATVSMIMATWPAMGATETLWRAGVARVNITPTQPIWLAGYGGRERPAEGKAMDLWLKALALEDARGHRAIIFTSDLLGVPQNIYSNVCAALKRDLHLAPADILLSASHTHCGPVLRGALYDIYPLDDVQRDLIEQYSSELESNILAVAASAIAKLAPARLYAGQGAAGFAVNRRNNTEKDVPTLMAHGKLAGPIDHSVPVLAVTRTNGELAAVLFGYACHNTVMAFNQWCGDFAGFAQLALERSHSNVMAMFFNGCGADQNPLPRRKLEIAERYGNMLAAAVEEVLRFGPMPSACGVAMRAEKMGLGPARMTPLPSRLDTTIETITLHLGAAPTEAELEKLVNDKNAATQRWAKRLLAQQKHGKVFIRAYPYPLQAWRFGGKQLLLTLGGEPVVDYALRFKKKFGAQTWVAGYCNDVMTYIPSRRVLDEDKPPLKSTRWGYEGNHAFIVYGLPAQRWADDVEDLIFAGAKRAVKGLDKAAGAGVPLR